jgi:hypothetical protein
MNQKMWGFFFEKEDVIMEAKPSVPNLKRLNSGSHINK